MKKQIIFYFNFSKKELNGILVLCVLIGLIWIIPECYNYFKVPERYDLSRFQSEIALFKTTATHRKQLSKAVSRKQTEHSLAPDYFEFDPNTISPSGWRRLGLSQKQIRILTNYRTKGGRFYKNEDLKKIYSITEEQYQKIAPYIHMESDKPKSYYIQRRQEAENKEPSKHQAVLVEINSADSSMLETIRGVGPAFASRIIRYRTRLGGFYNKSQLMEVFGIDSLKYLQLEKQVSVDSNFVRKLKINRVGFDDLKFHPYLTFKQINAIIRYRTQHGIFSSASDLRKVLILNDKIIRKIEPYLSFDP